MVNARRYLEDVLSLVPFVGPLFSQLQDLQTAERQLLLLSAVNVTEVKLPDGVRLTRASFWCSFSSMLRAVGESSRAI